MSSFRYRPYSNSNIKNRSRGNSKAANEQRDSTNVVLRKTLVVNAGQFMQQIDTSPPRLVIENGDIRETVDSVISNTGCAFINIYDVIRQSDYFSNLGSLYDQIKINSIKVDISAISWPNSAVDIIRTEDGYVYPKNLMVVTAWDRSGLSKDQVQFVKSRPGVSYPLYTNDNDGNYENLIREQDRRFYCTVGNEINSYSSALTRHLGTGGSMKVTRYLYPENMVEKSQYVSTSSIVNQYTNSVDFSRSYDMYTTRYDDDVNELDRVFRPSNWNINLPTNPLETPNLPFKPTLLINVLSAKDPTYTINDQGRIKFTELLKESTFSLDFSIDVTFRGLRYDKTV